MTKQPAPDRRPLFTQTQKGGDADSPRQRHRRQDKSQPRPSEGGAIVPSIRAAFHELSDEEREAIKNSPLKTLIGVWITDDMLSRIDAYRGGKTRPQAIRELLEEHLL